MSNEFEELQISSKLEQELKIQIKQQQIVIVQQEKLIEKLTNEEKQLRSDIQNIRQQLGQQDTSLDVEINDIQNELKDEAVELVQILQNLDTKIQRKLQLISKQMKSEQ